MKKLLVVPAQVERRMNIVLDHPRYEASDRAKELHKRLLIVDLAHASPAVIDDCLALATQPVVVSHTGMCGTQLRLCC
jgi:hypothetical protein